MSVVQGDPSNPVPAQILAQSILRLDVAVKALWRSGLNQKAIVLLLSDSSGIGKREVKSILYALDNLAKEYLAQLKK